MAHMQISTETSTWLLQAKDFSCRSTTAEAGSSAQRAAPGGEGAARACEARGAIRIRTGLWSAGENLIGAEICDVVPATRAIAVTDEREGPSTKSESTTPSRPPNVVATVCPSGISTMKAMAPLVGRPVTESFRERATNQSICGSMDEYYYFDLTERAASDTFSRPRGNGSHSIARFI